MSQKTILEYSPPPPVPTFAGENHVVLMPQPSKAQRRWDIQHPNYTTNVRALSRVRESPPEMQKKWYNRDPSLRDFASELCQAPPLVKDVTSYSSH